MNKIIGLENVVPVDILAFGVHPDDVELSSSGTLLAHIAKGFSVGLCDLTRGELGTRGNAELRLKEAETARQKMGAKYRVNLGYRDGYIQNDEKTLTDIMKVIRLAKPKIVLANALSDRHPDHGSAAKITADACFYAGLEKIMIKHDGDSLPKHRPNAVYHYVQDRNTEYDFVFDISGFFDKKMELIYSFKSQFYQGDDAGPQTPISGKDFMDFMQAKNRSYGRDIQVEHAEAFKCSRDIGVNNLFNLM